MKEVIEKVKEAKKCDIELLTTLLGQMQKINSKPRTLVRMSVHERIVARGDEGEERPLMDKKDGGRMGRPTGERNYHEPRGRGRGGRGGFDHGHGGHGRGRGGGGGGGRDDDRGGFYKQPIDEKTKLLQAEINAAASANMVAAKASKNDAQKVRMILNQITVDNVDPKIGELRFLLIGDRKLKSEEGFDEELAKDF